jgi:hypothetical protein
MYAWAFFLISVGFHFFFVACQDFSRVANCWNLSLGTAGTCRELQCLVYAGFLTSFGFSFFVLVKLLVEFSSQD